MSPRTGRPTSEPKAYIKSFRLSDNSLEKLKICKEKTGLSETDIIRKGIDLVYKDLKDK